MKQEKPPLNPEIEYHYNIINLLRLRDHFLWLKEIDSNPKVGFNMGFYYKKLISETLDKSGHKCNSVACIAGHACLLAKKEYDCNDSFTLRAREWLGLTQEEALYLFGGLFMDVGTPILDISINDVIKELNYMIKNDCVSRPQFMARLKPYCDVTSARETLG